jgi:hypothetical protein
VADTRNVIVETIDVSLLAEGGRSARGSKNERPVTAALRDAQHATLDV